MNLGTLNLHKDASGVPCGWSFSNVAAAATTVVKTGAGIFHSIVFNTRLVNGVVTIYDNTAGSGAKIATITAPATLLEQSPEFAIYDAYFTTGLTVVSTVNDDFTITFI